MMNDFYERAGLRIRELRESKRFTREQFSEIADISPKFLYEIETGQKRLFLQMHFIPNSKRAVGDK